jgi:hypothetical protein
VQYVFGLSGHRVAPINGVCDEMSLASRPVEAAHG